MLSEHQRKLVIQDFIDILKEKYGEEWIYHLTQKITPSPIAAIAEERDVKVFHVKQIRRQIKVVGQYIELIHSLIDPLPVSISPFTIDESF